MEKRPTLDDFDFSKVRHVELDPNYVPYQDSTILLRIVEGAWVALFREDKGSSVEMLPPRPNLYQYDGGYAWGYSGSGPQNLAHAIAGRIYEFDSLKDTDVIGKAYQILDHFLSPLDKSKEYDLQVSDIKQKIG